MNKDSFYMKIAYDEAKKAYNKNEVPVGAVIVLNDKIIAKAHNLKDSTGLVINHAEIIAIQKANKKLKDWRLTDAIMYVTLEPCPMCASAIQQSRISKLIYSASSCCKDNFQIITNILANPKNNHIVQIVKNSDFEKQCKSVIDEFFNKIR